MAEKPESKNPDSTPAPVPFAVHESALAFARETNTRQFWIIILLVILIFATNAGWIWYESQYETICYTQDGEGLNNICTGEQGAITYGAESPAQEETLREIQGAESPQT